MRTFTILFIIALLFVACSSQQQSSATQETTAQTTTPEEVAQVKSNVAKGMIGDSTMFPFVFQGPGSSLIFEAYTMRFTLEHQPPLIPLTNSEVPWLKPDAYNVNNGIYITYVRNGRQLSMQNPYVQVQYINKALPYCGTIDSVYMWMDQTMIQQSGAEVTEKIYEIATRSGKSAICKEYRTSPDAQRHSGKFLAYAYLDYNDEYIIGFNYTAMSPTDYEIGHNDFYNIVKSFDFY